MQNQDYQVRIKNLIFDIQKGDKKQFETLYDLTSPRLLGLILKVVHNREVAEEVLQDVFVKVWTQAYKFVNKQGCAWSWICVIARNQAIDNLRYSGRQESTYLMNMEPNEDTCVGLENQMDLEKKLKHLSEEEQDLLISTYVHGLTHQEISNVRRLPLGTVKSRIRRGLERLKLSAA